MRSYTKDWLQELCKDSYSYAEVLRKAGRKQGGGTQATLRKKLRNLKLIFLILQGKDGKIVRINKIIRFREKHISQMKFLFKIVLLLKRY